MAFADSGAGRLFPEYFISVKDAGAAMAMNFFESQEVARKKTGRLVAFFLVAVVAIVLTIYAVVAALFLVASQQQGDGPQGPVQYWNPDLFIGVAVGTVGLIVLGSAFKISQLSGGGRVVAEQLGGRLLNPSATDPDERKLLNVVEEMAIAAGTPVPPVYLLDKEEGINAFAAGFTPSDAVIGVTRGCERTLSRDELQGVIAHEFSHILNGDMRLNIRLMGVLHGILLIAISGFFLVRSMAFSGAMGSRSRGKDKSGIAMLLFGVALIAIGYIGVFFGKMIKAAVSRQREFLADASAVQFTRNPEGIAGALKKIGGLVKGSRIEHPEAEEASHMFFGNGVGASLTSLLATHPPLPVRIKRLDPGWDGEFPNVSADGAANVASAAGASQFAGAIRSRADRSKRAEAVPFRAADAMSHVGTPGTEHLAYATAVLSAYPEELLTLAHEPHGARAVIYALLTGDDSEVRSAQLERLAQHADPIVDAETRKVLPAIDRLGDELRLPLAELALPALRQLSESQFQAFRGNVMQLIGADQKTDLFEYALMRMLLRHLAPYFEKPKKRQRRIRSGAQAAAASVQVVSTLVHIGQSEPKAARSAFALAMDALGPGGKTASLLAKEECGLQALDQALDLLATASPAIKKRVLHACSAAVAADGSLTVEEMESLRAVADALDCPMPPLLATVGANS